MLLVILGAGASWDSVAEEDLLDRARREDWHPPLARELFDNRRTFMDVLDDYPILAPRVGRLRSELRRGAAIEDLLERFVAETEGERDRITQGQLLALCFYLRQIIQDCSDEWLRISKGVTNYALLLDKLRPWQRRSETSVAVVTFNYDTLLDAAVASALGWRLANFDDYMRQDFKFFKLHGSVNWWRVTNFPLSDRGEVLNRADQVRLDRRITWQGEGTGNATVPAIAIPTLGKASFECPEEHEHRLGGALRETTRVLVVGWRGQEKAFLERVREHVSPDVPGLIVDRAEEEARAIAAPIAQDGGLMGLRPAEVQGFSGFIRNDPGLDDLLEGQLRPGD